jgi:hypothetical protein
MKKPMFVFTSPHKRKFPHAAALLLGVSLLALPSCAWMYPSRAYLPSRSGIQNGGSVTVKPNENIYAIAREHNVSMRDLIVLNNLKPPYEIVPGQTLELPAGGTSSFAGDMPSPAAAPLASVEKNELAPIEPASFLHAVWHRPFDRCGDGPATSIAGS